MDKIKNKNITKITNKKSINNNNIYNFLKTSSKNINYISRNKNQSLEFNSIVNNTNNTNNKMNSATDIHNSVGKNSIYKTQYLINKEKYENVYNFKNNKLNKIKLNNDYNIFKSLKGKI